MRIGDCCWGEHRSRALTRLFGASSTCPHSGAVAKVGCCGLLPNASAMLTACVFIAGCVERGEDRSFGVVLLCRASQLMCASCQGQAAKRADGRCRDRSSLWGGGLGRREPFAGNSVVRRTSAPV